MTTQTANPICPTHNKEMRKNNRGWFCATKTGESSAGQPIWCDYEADQPSSTASKPQNAAKTSARPQAAPKSFKTEKGTELPLLELQGKPYLQVAHRLVWFREEHPTWGIETEALTIENPAERAIFTARIKDETGRLIATATKHETKAGFPDFIEKAETGAVGRALALCGYGTQFAPELEEGERLADAPITPAKKSPGQKKFDDQMPPHSQQPKSEAGKKIMNAAKQTKTMTAEEAMGQSEPLTEEEQAKLP